MKLPFYITVLVFALITFPEQSIAQTQQEHLIGTWTLDYALTEANMKVSEKAHFEAMPLERAERIKSSYQGRQITFYAHGNYLRKLADGREYSGTWQLNETQDVLIITDIKGRTQYQTIETLTADYLVLAPQSQGKKRLLISKWHFNKN